MKILLVYLHEDEKLALCLESLKKFSPNLEIIQKKADPKKTKVSEELYQEYFNSNEFTEDVIIWHPDMMATFGWYEDLMKYYEAFDVLGCKLLYPDGTIAHYGGAIHKRGTGHHPNQGFLNIGLNEPLSSAFVTGPGMVIKKKVWDKIKTYDFQFSYYIDVDFCFRARELGFSVGVVPATIIHLEGMDMLKVRPLRQTQQMQMDCNNKFVSKWMQTLATYK